MVILKRRLFPLHLTPFELYMLTDDSPDYPMTFQLCAELSGTLQVDHFETAFLDALSLHPLLTAIIQPAKRGIECWVQGSAAKVPLIYRSADTGNADDTCQFIDLRREPGLRVWVQQDEDRVLLVTQFHHSVCDAIGAYQFLGDWFYKYAELTGESELPPREEIPPGDLRARFGFTVDLSKFLDQQGKVRTEWSEYQRLKQNHFQPLCDPKSPVKSQPVRFPGFLTHTFSRVEHRDIRQLALSLGLTVHDWFLARLYHLLRDWNQENGPSDADQADFGVLLPLSLRGPGFRPCSACNVVSYAVVGRAVNEIDGGAGFLRKLGCEIDELKRKRDASSFINMLAAMRLYPAEMLADLLGADTCRASAVFSSTGDATKYFRTKMPLEKDYVRCGSLRLNTMTGISPLRPHTKIAISLSTNHRRELQVGMRCDPHSFSESDTAGMLQRFVGRLIDPELTSPHSSIPTVQLK